MSKWKCKTEDGELGPVSFEELAAMLREEKVKDTALVCRECAGNWEPAWRVPGLLRAAGIVEPGDSPATVVASGQPSVARTDEAAPPGYVAPPVKRPVFTAANVARGIVAAAVGVLAVGFFYRWASQAMAAFPMPPAVVDGETVDCYFPVVGRCTMLECGLLYVDAFAAAAAATWHAVGKRGAGGG